jgi:hypothetical protein
MMDTNDSRSTPFTTTFATAMAAIVIMFCGTHATADALTFSGGTLVETATSPNFPNYTWTYVEGGMQVTFYESFPNPDFVTFNFGGIPVTGMENGLYSIIDFSLVDGDAFTVDSFDFGGGGDTFINAYVDGNAVPDSGITLTDGASVFDPGATWSDITELQWCAQCVSGFSPNNAIGDLVYEDIPPGTPEPSTLSLFATALIFGWRCRGWRCGQSRKL